jgi:hypothetical protein
MSREMVHGVLAFLLGTQAIQSTFGIIPRADMFLRL